MYKVLIAFHPSMNQLKYVRVTPSILFVHVKIPDVCHDTNLAKTNNNLIISDIVFIFSFNI